VVFGVCWENHLICGGEARACEYKSTILKFGSVFSVTNDQTNNIYQNQ